MKNNIAIIALVIAAAIIGTVVPAVFENRTPHSATAETASHSGELTRPVALAKLADFLATSRSPVIVRPATLNFTDRGHALAINEGLIVKVPFRGFSPYPDPHEYQVTQRGREVFGAIIQGNGVITFGQLVEVRFNQALPIVPTQVTGISSVPGMNGMMKVDFLVRYEFPPALREIVKYLPDGERMSMGFRKYDDGWRVDAP